MALVARDVTVLKPDLRIIQAVSEFEATLSDDLKLQLRRYRNNKPPNPSDVLRLSAELNLKSKTKQRCFGPRFQRVLEFVQRYSGVLNTAIGGSQQPIASGVWGVIRLSLEVASGHVVYFEKLSELFMEIGQDCPRYEKFGTLFPTSSSLQTAVTEYFIVIVSICTKVVKFSTRGTLSQLGASMLRSYDSEFGSLCRELKIRAHHVDNEVSLASKIVDSEENSQASRFRIGSLKLMRGLSKDLRQIQLSRSEQTKAKYLESIPIFTSNYAYYIQSRKFGSPSWFKKDLGYVKWKDSTTANIILCHGRLGSGKTVITSNVIDDIVLHTTPGIVAYFFCRIDEHRSHEARVILGTIARQLIDSSIIDLASLELPTSISSDWTCESIVEFLISVLPPNMTYFIVVDGLDECQDSEQEDLLRGILALIGSNKQIFKVYLSCRNDIKSTVIKRLAPQYELDSTDRNNEIEQYIRVELQLRLDTGDLLLGDPGLIIQILEALVNGAEGMFLWVKLQIQTLCLLRTDQEILDALQHLPRDLENTYKRIAQRLFHTQESLNTVRSLFLIMAAAKRAMTKCEIRECLAIIPGDTKSWSPLRLSNDMARTIALGGSLLFVDEEMQTLHFVHSSLLKCLKNIHNDVYPGLSIDRISANNFLGAICVTYLSLDVFASQLVRSKVSESNIVKLIPMHTASETLPPRLSSVLASKLLASISKQPSLDVRKVLQEHYSNRSTEENKSHFLDYAVGQWRYHTQFLQLLEDKRPWELLKKICRHEVNLHSRFPGHISDPYSIFVSYREGISMYVRDRQVSHRSTYDQFSQVDLGSSKRIALLFWLYFVTNCEDNKLLCSHGHYLSTIEFKDIEEKYFNNQVSLAVFTIPKDKRFTFDPGAAGGAPILSSEPLWQVLFLSIIHNNMDQANSVIDLLTVPFETVRIVSMEVILPSEFTQLGDPADIQRTPLSFAISLGRQEIALKLIGAGHLRLLQRHAQNPVGSLLDTVWDRTIELLEKSLRENLTEVSLEILKCEELFVDMSIEAQQQVVNLCKSFPPYTALFQARKMFPNFKFISTDDEYHIDDDRFSQPDTNYSHKRKEYWHKQ